MIIHGLKRHVNTVHENNIYSDHVRECKENDWIQHKNRNNMKKPANTNIPAKDLQIEIYLNL